MRSCCVFDSPRLSLPLLAVYLLSYCPVHLPSFQLLLQRCGGQIPCALPLMRTLAPLPSTTVSQQRDYKVITTLWEESNMPADNRPITIHCKAGSTSVRLVFESRAKCQDFVVRYKDDGITYDIDSPFCSVKTTITLRVRKLSLNCLFAGRNNN